MFKDFLCKKILSRNLNLYNSFLDKTCYVFGNGYSLKYLDLKKFNNFFSFTCGLNYLHKDFNYLKLAGDFHLHPGIFSPIWRHPYTKKIIFTNKTRNFLFKTKRIPNKTNFFTSIYNYPFLKKHNNIFFLHNFKKKFDFNKINPTSEFSLMSGSIFSMIGVATYMGFRKMIFVGMDYLSSEPRAGHFYEHGIREKIINQSTFVYNTKLVTDFFEKNYNCEFNFLSVNNWSSSYFKNINYSEYLNASEIYKENRDLIDTNILNDLSKIEFKYLINEK